MTVFQTYNKRYRIFNVVIWIEILQLHRYTTMVFTWLYSLDFKENFQSIEEHGGNKYTCLFFSAGLFTCFSAWIRWCVLKIQALQPVKNRKTFFLATLNQPLIDFKYISVLEILSSWRLGSDAWPACVAHTCMTDMTNLIFFFSDFISFLSCIRGISAKLNKQYYFRFPDKYFFC